MATPLPSAPGCTVRDTRCCPVLLLEEGLSFNLRACVEWAASAWLRKGGGVFLCVQSGPAGRPCRMAGRLLRWSRFPVTGSSNGQESTAMENRGRDDPFTNVPVSESMNMGGTGSAPPIPTRAQARRRQPLRALSGPGATLWVSVHTSWLF